MAAPPGYHWKQTEDGSCVIEEDHPAPGYTTLTWSPASDSPTAGGSLAIPSALFAEVADDYIGHRDALRARTIAASKKAPAATT